MINIKQKLVISLFVLISMLVAVFKIFETSLRNIEDLKDAIGLSRKLNQEIVNIRKSEKSFFAFKTEHVINKFESRNNMLSDTLARIKEKRLPVVIELEHQIESALAEYRAAFYSISEYYGIIGFDQNSGLRGDVYDYNIIIDKIVSSSDDSDLVTKFLIMHNKEMELFIRKNKVSRESFDVAYNNFVNHIENQLVMDVDSKNILLHKTNTYRSSIDNLFYLELEVESRSGLLLSNLGKTAHHLENLLLQLEEVLIENLLSADKEVTVKSTLMMVLLAIGLFLLAIVPFLIFLTLSKHR